MTRAYPFSRSHSQSSSSLLCGWSISRVPALVQGRALENPGDGLAAHPGADDRAAVLRAGEAEAVGKLEAHPVLEPGFGGMAARARERARADIGGDGAGYGAARDEAYGQVAVVRAHVAERIRPGRRAGRIGRASA